MFPEFKDAEMWRKKGIKIFEDELKTQVLPDGFIWEQSTGYHKFVTDFLLHIVVLMKKNGLDIPETFLQKLGQSLEALYYVAKPDEFLPLVGDEDQGFVVNLSESDYADAKPTISCGAISLGKDKWKRTNCEENLWLFGSSSLTEKSANSKIGSRLFENSGFMVMRDDDKYMLISIGPQDSRYSHAPHKHMDELSFALDANGTSFIVDPGTYTYFGEFEWRKYFKRRKAHNTIVIDDKDPVDIKEIFESSNVPICKIHDYKISDRLDWIATEYNGYQSVTHTRQILFVKPEYWIIIDSLRGDGEHTCDLYFHFNHGLDLRRNKSDQSITAANGMGDIKISPLLTSGLDEEILDGEISPKYGVKVKAPILRYRKTGKLPITFITLLHPSAKDNQNIEFSQFDVYGEDGEPLKDNEAVGIKVASNGHTDYLACSLDGMPRVLSFEKAGKIRRRILYRRKQGKSCEAIIL
jgi:hypothetical protein